MVASEVVKGGERRYSRSDRERSAVGETHATTLRSCMGYPATIRNQNFAIGNRSMFGQQAISNYLKLSEKFQIADV